MKSSSDQARAEAVFKKEERARQGQKATTEYQAERQATLNKMAKLRAQRLARDAELTNARGEPMLDEPAQPTDRRRRGPARRGAIFLGPSSRDCLNLSGSPRNAGFPSPARVARALGGRTCCPLLTR
jgi:hypothetical protein